jgi:hypothetical protein
MAIQDPRTIGTMMDEFSKQYAKDMAELDYLRWFKQHTDFGPADGDVQDNMNAAYEARTGKKVPEGWRRNE